MKNIVWCGPAEIGSARVALSTGEWLTYRCVPEAHQVVVTDDRGRTQFAFGAHGRLPGQLDTPLDLAIVTPQFDGEALPTELADAFWLAVADYGNARLQIFELNGSFVTTLGYDEGLLIGSPCRLVWCAPLLEVHAVDGTVSRVHLAAAMLTHAESLFSGPEWGMPPFVRVRSGRARMKVC